MSLVADEVTEFSEHTGEVDGITPIKNDKKRPRTSNGDNRSISKMQKTVDGQTLEAGQGFDPPNNEIDFDASLNRKLIRIQEVIEKAQNKHKTRLAKHKADISSVNAEKIASDNRTVGFLTAIKNGAVYYHVGYESRPLNYFKQFGTKREIIFEASAPGDQVTRYSFELSKNLPIFKNGTIHYIDEKTEFEEILDFATEKNSEEKFLTCHNDFRLKV